MGLLRLMHPFPTLMNLLATLLFATLALGRFPEWRSSIALILGMGGAQAGIGIVNDLVDQELDRTTGRPKPLANSLVTPRQALSLLAVVLILAILGAGYFGLPSLGFVLLGTGLGFAYNCWLKRTPFSWLPYLLAIPLEPIWVFVALGRFTPLLLWLYPIGGLLLLALHLANALADWHSDSAAGITGLAQRLGRRHAQGILWSAAFLSAALATALGLVVPYRWERFWPGLALAVLPGLVGVLLVLRQPERDSVYRTVFGLLLLSTLILAVVWLAVAI